MPPPEEAGHAAPPTPDDPMFTQEVIADALSALNFKVDECFRRSEDSVKALTRQVDKLKEENRRLRAAVDALSKKRP